MLGAERRAEVVGHSDPAKRGWVRRGGKVMFGPHTLPLGVCHLNSVRIGCEDQYRFFIQSLP